MPNVVYLWDFEDGTTQGWALGPYTTLDSTAQIQGTYSLKYAKFTSTGTYTYLIGSISGVSLTNVSKPILLLIVKDNSGHYWVNSPSNVRVVVKEGDTTIADKTITVLCDTTGIIRVVAVALPEASGKIVTIELYDNYTSGVTTTITRYYDMIAIIDGADYEYNTGLVAFYNEDKTIDVTVPSPDNDVSTIGTDRFAIDLATPDWYTSTMEATAITNTASLRITTGDTNTRHSNYTKPSTAPSLFTTLRLRVYTSLTGYAGFAEKIAVVFLGSDWSYKRVYVFNVYYTINGFSDRFASSVSTTTYGSSVTGSRTVTAKVHGNNFDVALRVRYLVGSPSVVTSGFVKLEVYSGDMSTKYGELTVDITLGGDQTTAYITLPTDTDLRFIISYSITASARVVLLVVPLVRVY